MGRTMLLGMSLAPPNSMGAGKAENKIATIGVDPLVDRFVADWFMPEHLPSSSNAFRRPFTFKLSRNKSTQLWVWKPRPFMSESLSGVSSLLRLPGEVVAGVNWRGIAF